MMNREREEVRQACHQCLRDVDEALHVLSRSKGLGIWDALGGSTFINLAKRRRMSEASAVLSRLEQSLDNLQRELRDVHFATPYLNRRSFVFDVVFDNIFTDLGVLNDIDQTMSELEQLRNQLLELDRQLD